MRNASCSITFKLTPAQLAQLKEAIGTQDDAWLGMSHHVRMAALNWARGILSSQRLRQIRRDVVSKTGGAK
jgi:hypothetical protein